MTGVAVSIRHATARDASGVLECLRRAFEPYRQAYTPDGFRDTVLTDETIHERMASMSVLVAETMSGEIVGTVATQVTSATEGHVRGMAVVSSHQSAGVAAQLLAAAENEIRARGCTRVSLDTTEPLQRAIRFYERHGYRPSGHVGDFFGMRLIEYVKDLR